MKKLIIPTVYNLLLYTRFCLVLLAFLLVPRPGMADEPFADVHLHFNWDQEELVSAEEALAILNKHNVVFAVVFSVPSDNALKLSKLKPDTIIPFFSPYISGHSRNNWFYDPKVLERARAGLQQGIYQGIGELHVISGLGPRRDNPVLQGLFSLAAEFNVPFNIHTETSDYRFLAPLCQQHPKVRFLWAHAGGILGPEHSEGILKACSNVWIELSARDPKHYGGLLDDHGNLRKGWYDIITRYPDRFMLGTDPVWNAHQVNRWNEADEGWKHYSKFIQFHRKWIKSLPEEVEKKLRLENALRFFKIESN
ncbi:hypothetical protein MNBD_GAMMA21-2289 [hydrothermal vent metagenome]|uniref:Amidohydrolase-related domain-containing protein n=1 Tax=hydrothermal vent metagenome TaxID=652676 RepID=A0A3B1B6U0_9ZZZZ